MHDVRISKGVRLASESIIKLSPSGKFLETIRKWSYEGRRSSTETERMRAVVVGMCGTDSSVIFIHKGKDSLFVTDSADSTVKDLKFANVEDTVLSAT